MAAAAFKASLIYKTASGKSKTRFCTVSDVAAAFYVFESGSTEPVINPTETCYLVDIVLSAAGTDTTTGEIYINGISSGVKFLNATTLGTVVGRPFLNAPVMIPAGSTFRITQLA